MKGKMRSDLYSELYEVENTHWWHQHKRYTIHQLIEKYTYNKGRILDIGSGTGKILEELQKRGWNVQGVDGAAEAVAWSNQRGIPIKQADFVKETLPYKDKTFDAVLALDLLEHIPNDTDLLNDMYRVLRPGGIAIITVPAYQQLFNYWDEMLGHQRRYNLPEIVSKFKEMGWEIRFNSYYFGLFLLPAYIVRKLKNISKKQNTPESDFKTTPIAWLSIPVMNAYARFERFILKYAPLPFGLSVVVVAQKP